MIRIVQLLTEKNHFLEKFFALNEKSLESFHNNNFETLEHFYNQRENLIKIIQYIDSEIAKAHQLHKVIHAVASMADKKAVKECLDIKEEYVKKILEQDVEILGLIDNAKTKIILELQDVRRGKNAMKGYKQIA